MESVPNPWSESDDWFRPFHAPFNGVLAFTEENLRPVLKVGPRYKLVIEDTRLQEAADNWRWSETAMAFRMLDQIMTANLTTPRRVVARAPGAVRVRVWLIGELELDEKGSSYLVGLKSISTET